MNVVSILKLSFFKKDKIRKDKNSKTEMSGVYKLLKSFTSFF